MLSTEAGSVEFTVGLGVSPRWSSGDSCARPSASTSWIISVVETHIGSVFAKLGIPVSAQENRRVRAVVTYLGAIGAATP